MAGSVWNHQNLTRIAAANNGKLMLNCDMCGLEFRRYVCHAKRTANHFCGQGCKNAFASMVGTIDHPCPVCGVISRLVLSDAARNQTCTNPTCSKTMLLRTYAGNNPEGHLTRTVPNSVAEQVLAAKGGIKSIADSLGLSYGQVHRIKTGYYKRNTNVLDII